MKWKPNKDGVSSYKSVLTLRQDFVDDRSRHPSE